MGRDRLAALTALAATASLAIVFLFSKGTAFLMPGPLTSAHGGIEACSACHTQSGDSKLKWVKGLVAGDPHADSKACISCHKMPDTALNAHGASAEILKNSTERLTKIATKPPRSARVQSTAFPMHDMMSDGVTCATCHQEHQGANFNLNKISNEQCRSCHVVKFDSFDGNHPKFENYPFERRTRVVYDHAGHFNKHYPEVAKKDPSKRIPETCSSCHNSRDDKRYMAVASFDKTCSTCHLDQITGKEQASGPKGVAFLALPGLDLESLNAKGASIGEWPEGSEAALTPFMKMMISRTKRGRALIKNVESLNLQDLANANVDQIKAVTNLVWETKALFHALIAGKASDVLGDLSIAGGAKLSTELVVDLTASLPRDVVASAQQQWLPNLSAEMSNRKVSGDEAHDAWAALGPEPSAAVPPSAPAEEVPAKDEASGDKTEPPETETAEEKSEGEQPPAVKRDPPPCVMRLFGQCLLSKGQGDGVTEPASSKKKSAANRPPGAMRAGLQDMAQAQGKTAGQADELLSPSADEQREIDAHNKRSGKTSRAHEGATTNTNEAQQPGAAPVISIDSGVDPESWAEYGGWYRQDHAILYRPTGHKDKFIYSWLFLTGPQAKKGEASPAAAAFDALTHKDAQGSCTKCHSIDDIPGKGRVVNFTPATFASKQGRFTQFVHEPHFGTMDDRGCLTCHTLEKGRPYLKSYEQGNPQSFASDFGAVKKDLCQTCHTATKARQDCLTCHKYHVNGVVTPITATKLPTQ